MKTLFSAVNGVLERMLGIRIIRKKQGSELTEYSAVLGMDSLIPACQIELFFLALNKYLRLGDHVLDVGFGTGYGLNVFSIKAAEIHGIDVDRHAIKYATTRLLGRNPKLKEVRPYDGYSTGYPDNSFDIVTAVEVLEHVEDYHRFLKEMMRISRRGVYITTPNRRPEFTNPDGTPKNHWHLREWNFDELDTILRAHGSVDWNCVNGPYDGPFTITDTPQADTLDLAPFLRKR